MCLYLYRCWLMLERCRKSLQNRNVPCFDHLPLTNLSGHSLESLSKHRLYAKIPKQSEHYLVGDSDILIWSFYHWLLKCLVLKTTANSCYAVFCLGTSDATVYQYQCLQEVACYYRCHSGFPYCFLCTVICGDCRPERCPKIPKSLKVVLKCPGRHVHVLKFLSTPVSH